MTPVGVIRETAPAEYRVAIPPDAVADITALGLDTLVETGAGARAWWPDSAYAAAGALVVPTMDLFQRADIVLSVDGADDGTVRRLRTGRVLVGLLAPLRHPSLVRTWLDCGITTISLDQLPGRCTQARAMDVATTQETVAGYKAVLLAAATYGGFFPTVVTPSGNARPGCSCWATAWRRAGPSVPRAGWAPRSPRTRSGRWTGSSPRSRTSTS